VKELLKKWAIGGVDTIAPTPSGGGRTWFVKTLAKRDFVLKGSDLSRSEREIDVLLGLSKTQIPAALPVATAGGDWYVKGYNGKVYCLFPRLPGHVVAEHYAGDAEKRALGFGRAIGLLHACLRERADVSGYRETALVEQIEEWAIRCIREGRATVDAGAIEQIWRAAESELRPLYKELPRQLIHRDAHPSNMLFSAGRLTGFVDFEMVRRGPRVFDVCYCGSSILVGGFEDPEKGQKWPNLFRCLVRGYEEFCPLTASERLAVYGVFVTIELLFIAFSLDMQNEDAARTNERLLYWLATNRDSLAM
jgi:Ser/Thr protein kinase RdoA (MazF antagonist)